MDFVEVPVSEDASFSKENARKQKKQKKSADKAAENSEVELVATPSDSLPSTSFNLSEIKNKQRRHLMFIKLKQEKRKVTLLPHGNDVCKSFIFTTFSYFYPKLFYSK